MPGFIKNKNDEQLWSRAKSLAKEQGHAKDYGYVTTIYKSLNGGKVAEERVASAWLSRQANNNILILIGQTQGLISLLQDRLDDLRGANKNGWLPDQKMISTLMGIHKHLRDAIDLAKLPSHSRSAANSAADVFYDDLTAVAGLMAKLKQKIIEHTNKFKQSGETNWGYAGDMGRIRHDLADLLRFMAM